MADALFDAAHETRIREATPRDAGEVAGLWTEAYVVPGGGRAQPYTEADYDELARHGRVFVTDREGDVVGVVALLAPGSPGGAVSRPEEAELSRLAVTGRARGRGLGRALAAHCEGLARSAGWRAIALWSRPGQTDAHRLYEALGYRRVPGRDSTDSGGDRLVFRLDL